MNDNMLRDMVDILKALKRGKGFTTKQVENIDRILWELQYGKEAKKSRQRQRI